MLGSAIALAFAGENTNRNSVQSRRFLSAHPDLLCDPDRRHVRSLDDRNHPAQPELSPRVRECRPRRLRA